MCESGRRELKISGDAATEGRRNETHSGRNEDALPTQATQVEETYERYRRDEETAVWAIAEDRRGDFRYIS